MLFHIIITEIKNIYKNLHIRVYILECIENNAQVY